MSATGTRQARGWWAELVQAECDHCGWVGPTRDASKTNGRSLVREDVREHECGKEPGE
jgi:hypothetical protein